MDFYPTEGTYPITKQGPDNFYPPVCNQFHFDPTQIIKRTLPDQPYSVPLPLDPRPWTKVCLEYVNSSTNEPAPKVDPNIAFPAGGFFQDPNRYLASVDSESQLRRLNQPLRKCDAGQFEPNTNGDMFNSRILMPANPTNPSRIPDIALPKTLITVGPYKCREEVDAVNMAVSNKPFFNATKQERYYIQTKLPTNLRKMTPSA